MTQFINVLFEKGYKTLNVCLQRNKYDPGITGGCNSSSQDGGPHYFVEHDDNGWVNETEELSYKNKYSNFLI